MPLLLSGRGFRQDLEQAGALALFVPLEGGAETRLCGACGQRVTKPK